MTEPKKIKAYLVAGGKYHDIDYARLEILQTFSSHIHVMLCLV